MSDFFPFAAAVFVVSIFAGVVGLAKSHINELRQQAIERGYALHCPADGRWAWKGECE